MFPVLTFKGILIKTNIKKMFVVTKLVTTFRIITDKHVSWCISLSDLISG